ncbi:MAG: glycosyltransferase, partial [Novosphingobium sp.]
AEANDLDVTEIEVVDGYIRMTARDRAGAPPTARSADELLKATATGALAAQDRHYTLMAKRAALVEARGKDIAKHTATIADLKAAAETRAKALRELEGQLASTGVLLEQSRAADAKAQAELAATRKAAEEAATAAQNAAKAAATAASKALEQAETAGRKALEHAEAAARKSLDQAADEARRASNQAAEALLHAQQEAHDTKLALDASLDEAARLRAEIAEAKAQISEARLAIDRTSSDHAGTLTELADAQAAYTLLQDQFEEMHGLALGLRESIAQQDIEHLRAAEQSALSLKEADAQLAETRDALTRDIAARHAEIAQRDQEIAQRVSELARRDAELAESRASAAREKRSAVMSERAQQRALTTYERQANTLKQSIAYQLGMILLQGFKSLQAFFAMPGKLLALRREHAQRRRMRGDRPVRELGGKDYPHLLARLKSDGFAAACGMIDALDLPGPARANAYTALARQLQGKDPAASARAATIGHEADPQPWRAKWLAYRMYDAGHLLEPARLLRELPDTVVFSASEESRTAQIAALADLFEIKPILPYVGSAQYEAKPRSMLYIAASAMPYHLSGYTVRTAALLTALKTAGIELTVATRPGYPWDRSDTAQSAKANQTDFGGLTYHHFRQPAQDMPLDVYIERSAAAIARLARQKQVGVIHAASNHVNALPALIAARQLGIPFHFEMRGLWEMSRASNVEGFEASERYQLGLDLEKFVARHADRVYAISQPLAEFLRDDWGVEPETIAVLANGIDSSVFSALTAQPPSQFTIGYAGALVAYEGLDLLLDAVAQLRAGGTAVSLVLVGDGVAREALEARVRALRLEGAVEFTGKISPELARARIAACSLVCLPRRPDQVCELVPPIKLVETMALGVPLVVPDLAAFRAEVENGVTALFFRSGDSADLARAIAAVHADPAAAGARANAARERALAGRDWSLAAALIEANLDPAKRQLLPSVEAPRARRTARKQSDAGNESLAALLADQERLTAVFEEHGIAPFVAEIDRQPALVGKARAHELMRIGRALTDAGLGKAEAGLVDEALQADRSPGVLIWAYNTYQRLGEFEQTEPVLAELERHPVVIANPAEQARVEKLKGGLAYQLAMLRLIEPRRSRAFEPVGNRICYMLHNSLPYSSGGYATRSHGVATGLRDTGFDVMVMTRPGFPNDTVAGLEDQMVPEIDEIDGISYCRTFEPQRRSMKFMHYVPEAARVLE